jgi:hypothetical protein
MQAAGIEAVILTISFQFHGTSLVIRIRLTLMGLAEAARLFVPVITLVCSREEEGIENSYC